MPQGYILFLWGGIATKPWRDNFPELQFILLIFEDFLLFLLFINFMLSLESMKSFVKKKPNNTKTTEEKHPKIGGLISKYERITIEKKIFAFQMQKQLNKLMMNENYFTSAKGHLQHLLSPLFLSISIFVLGASKQHKLIQECKREKGCNDNKN